MPDLIVINKGLYHNGRAYAVGERFTATPVDAGYYKKNRQAADAPAVHKPHRKVAETVAAAVIEVASAVEPLADGTTFSVETPAPRRYLHRRLKAED